MEREIDADHVLVNIEGYYLAVENRSDQKLKVNETVKFYVDSIAPLRLKLSRSKRGVVT